MSYKIKKRKVKKIINSIIFLLPALVGFFIFELSTFFYGIFLSFYKYDFINPPIFVGLNNYLEVITNYELFFISLINVTKYILGEVSITIILGLILAIFLNRSLRGANIARTLHLVPHIISSMIIVYIFRMLFSPSFGPINKFLGLMGLPKMDIFEDPNLAIFGLILMMSYRGLGYRILIITAGLSSISEELYDAAKTDGASAFQQALYITIPLLKPILLFLTITGIISAIQIFSAVLTWIAVLEEAGPGERLIVPVLLIYQNAFKYGRAGRACAMATMLFLIILIITLVQFVIGKKQR